MLTVQIMGVVSFWFLPGLWYRRVRAGPEILRFSQASRWCPGAGSTDHSIRSKQLLIKSGPQTLAAHFESRPHISGNFRKWPMTRCHPSESDLVGLRRGLSTGFSEVFLIDSNIQPKLRTSALEQWFFSYSCWWWWGVGVDFIGGGAGDALNILWCTDTPQAKDDFTHILIAPRLRNPGWEDVARSTQFIFICFLFTDSNLPMEHLLWDFLDVGGYKKFESKVFSDNHKR